ncbi:bifunctional serine/threonine-protein kinase/formylglycine-generating enzyme family protein [Pannus brasiliensis CCIBt3594]|uniref:Bifunctional serine/threonine-protein kinase/formylglycine-generating enzyme family protein n=1 Tax=Pannus brasiliensis CCIBt3594 TaxID=1427578 RepID=A0AAW9R049_9CHRO
MKDTFYRLLEGQKIGHYHLENLLGVGGFGGVFRASEVVRDRVLRQVAIKIMPNNDERQLAELIAAVNLEHENLIRSYSAGECTILDTDTLYLAMELADGSLEKRLFRGSFSPDEIRQFLREMLAALRYLHDRNQVHRDVKPANILRVKECWKLSDFGLIRRLGDRDHDRTANPVGTIAYMPPEAFDGHISPAWDMWSLGILLVLMTAKKLPYRFDEPAQLLKKVMNGDLELPSLPEEIRPIVLGCLQVERQNRWTARQALSALDSPTPAFPVPPVLAPSPAPSKTVVPPVLPPSPAPSKTVSIDSPEEIPAPSSDSIPKNVPIDSYEEILRSPTGQWLGSIEMLYIPPGEFLMGSPSEEIERHKTENSLHRVKIAGFYLSRTPITQAQWRAVAGLPPEGKSIETNPSYFTGEGKPVERVSWQDCLEFCARLSARTGKTYRLPAEAEWEYACRAGTTTPFYFGETLSTEIANYDGNYAYSTGEKGSYRKETTEVGIFPPNAFGLHDTHGNVFEWCLDPWHESYWDAPNNGRVWDEKYPDGFYRDLLANLKVLLADTRTRVIRGGSWSSIPRYCRSAYRRHFGRASDEIGFRIASVPPKS